MVSTITQKILIIEEEADILELLSYNLSKAGFLTEAKQVYSPSSQEAETFVPDMVILGNFPDEQSKIDTIVALKSNPQYQNLRIVCLSTDDNYLHNPQFKGLAIDACITTPIKPRLFVNKINQLFRGTSSSDSLHYEA